MSEIKMCEVAHELTPIDMECERDTSFVLVIPQAFADCRDVANES